ncbi:unnamed protein product [Penicillium salamii]|nr:unnamed protein product [Penicillium salamii]CAG8390350.1 unnamed protein product [Penicillium salamii]CAG8426577.1 unnamed protein product [Penicillium salamii]
MRDQNPSLTHFPGHCIANSALLDTMTFSWKLCQSWKPSQESRFRLHNGSHRRIPCS